MQLRVGVRVDGLYAGRRRLGFPAPSSTPTTVCLPCATTTARSKRTCPERLLRLHEVGTWTVGSRVLARYNGDDDFYPGTITAVDDENRLYDIAYDDGEVEDNVSYALIMD